MTGASFRTPGLRVASLRDDPLYPRIERAVAVILAKGNVVAPVDVLVGMNLLASEKLDAWRRGQVPYLERVIRCNLTRLSRILRILRFHGHDLNLAPAVTAYMRLGRGPKQRLRFSKTGEPNLEEAYATHLIWPSKGPFHPPERRRVRQAPINRNTTSRQSPGRRRGREG